MIHQKRITDACDDGLRHIASWLPNRNNLRMSTALVAQAVSYQPIPTYPLGMCFWDTHNESPFAQSVKQGLHALLTRLVQGTPDIQFTGYCGSLQRSELDDWSDDESDDESDDNEHPIAVGTIDGRLGTPPRFAILQNTFEPMNSHHLGFDRVCFSLGLDWDADSADSAVRDFVSGVVTPWTTEQTNQAMSSGLRYRFEFNAGISGLSNGDYGDSVRLCFDFSYDNSIRGPDLVKWEQRYPWLFPGYYE